MCFNLRRALRQLQGLRLKGLRLKGLRLKGLRLKGLRLKGLRLKGLRRQSLTLRRHITPRPLDYLLEQAADQRQQAPLRQAR
jgi:hypothetical protein